LTAVRLLQTDGAAATEAVGAELAATLQRGDVVLLEGEFGTGKTTLVRGACRALGVTGRVTSPTFAIGNRYYGANVVVSHLDLYRLRSVGDEVPELLDDYLGPDTIAFVEWPGGAAADLGRVRFRISLTHAGGDHRTLEIA
jgi:tRNA threonylcarbamoyladenosine biosynthesis protein TsaE